MSLRAFRTQWHEWWLVRRQRSLVRSAEYAALRAAIIHESVEGMAAFQPPPIHSNAPAFDLHRPDLRLRTDDPKRESR